MNVIHPRAFDAEGRMLVGVAGARRDADSLAEACRDNGENVRVYERQVRAAGCAAVVWVVVRTRRQVSA